MGPNGSSAEAARDKTAWARMTARCALAMLALLTATTLLGFLDALGWLPELVANLRPQQALALIALTGVLLVIGPRWTAWVAASAAIVNLVLVVPFLVPASPPPVTPGAETLELLLLNVKVDRADPDELIQELRARAPDVVVLVAATPQWVEAIEAADLELQFVSGPHLTESLEVIVLTREVGPPTVVHRPTDDMRSALVEVELRFDGDPLHLLATHPVSPMTPVRSEARDEQLAWIGSWARQRGPSTLVVGDLNVTPWSAAYRRLLDEGDLIDPQRVHGLQPSWPARLGPLGLPIDHVLHGPALAARGRELGPSFGSDHRSVRASVVRLAPGSDEQGWREHSSRGAA
jgi:endonuclease/exonuclease/phosphatase (EEP) superfamily protein YafD